MLGRLARFGVALSILGCLGTEDLWPVKDRTELFFGEPELSQMPGQVTDIKQLVHSFVMVGLEALGANRGLGQRTRHNTLRRHDPLTTSINWPASTSAIMVAHTFFLNLAWRRARVSPRPTTAVSPTRSTSACKSASPQAMTVPLTVCQVHAQCGRDVRH